MREIFFNSFKEKILNGQVPQSFDVTGVPVNSKFFDSYDNTDIAIEQYKNLSDFDTYARNVSGIPKFKDTMFEYSSYGVEYSAYQNDDIGEKPIFVNAVNSAKFFEIYGDDFDAGGSARLFEYMTLQDENDVEEKEELRNTNSGFYYVTKKSQLHWLADRCNDENNYNNKIKIVLGDDIGNLNDMDTLESMICTTPERPFQGIFDMNGHKLINKKFICNQNSNGLIGYLGPNGIVRNGIVENITFINQKKISLDKIVNDCSDVVVGALVGTNFGTVENIITSGRMEFNGFCPEVYLVNNKYEYQFGDSTNNNSAYNGFFPNKFCINSIYNVLPYCGYFNEGADSFFNDLGRSKYWLSPKNKYIDPSIYHNNLSERNTHLLMDDLVGNMGFTRGPAVEEVALGYYLGFDHYSEPKQSISDGYDQAEIKLIPALTSNAKQYWNWIDSPTFATALEIVKEMVGDALVGPDYQEPGVHESWYITPMIPIEYTQYYLDRVLGNTINSLGSWKSYDEVKTYEIAPLEMADDFRMNEKDINYASYLAQQMRDIVQICRDMREKHTPHQRMNPNVRIAYFCSPIVGNNFGTIQNIDCRHSIHESRDTFVGFIGGVCGKENCGMILNVNAIYDIVQNDIFGKDSGAQNLSRTYTKQKKYLPDYSEDYANISQAFVYNWDYFQTSAGVDSDYMDGFSATSADSIIASRKFYDFNDFECSGVNGCWYNAFIFNKFANKTDDFSNCNFAVEENTNPGMIGSGIDNRIRSAKLRFTPEDSAADGSAFKFYYDLEVTRFTSGTEGESDYYDITYPFQGEVKIFNDTEESWKSNTQYPILLSSAESGFKEDFNAVFKDLNIKHFSVDYLGDAAKTLMSKDEAEYFAWHEKANGSNYRVTMSDAMNYSPAFNGDLGNTMSNANAFAKNIMNAKIAMGADILANTSLDPEKPCSGWNSDPLSTGGPFGTNNHYQDEYKWDQRTYEDFVIPAMTGPNDTNDPWRIFYHDSTDHGMLWYGAPGSKTYHLFNDIYKTCRPIPTSTRQVGNGLGIDSVGYKPTKFCSTREDRLWDVLNKNMDSNSNQYIDEDGNYLNTSAFSDAQMRDMKNFGLQRSMITIDFLSDKKSKTAARSMAIWLAEKTTIFGLLTGDNSLPTDTSTLITLFGSDWEADINNIRIPMFNRNQNMTVIKDNFEGVAGTSGMYFKQVHGVTRQVVDFGISGYSTKTTLNWKRLFKSVVRNSEDEEETDFEPNEEYPSQDVIEFMKDGIVGNIDDMFVDMTIYKRDSGRTFKKFNILFRLPLSSIRFPISAFSAGRVDTKDTTACTFDLAHSVTTLPDDSPAKTHKVRDVNFYPLIPAYDPEETNGTYVNYQLKSIYNIGGICGMINHSEKNIQYGNHHEIIQKIEEETGVRYEKGWGVNYATNGIIQNVFVTITENTKRFINRLCEVTEYDEDGVKSDSNPRTIGVANKFAMVAPVYEYHQNEMGTSPDPGLSEEFNTNGLTRIDLDAQTFRLININCIGSINANLNDINGRLFKPIVEWANVSNILDYNNFYDFKFTFGVSNSRYFGHESSNYPETTNILHDYCSLAMGAPPTHYTNLNCKLIGAGQIFMNRDSFPIYSVQKNDDHVDTLVAPIDWITTGNVDWKETIASEELFAFGANSTYDTIRNSIKKGVTKIQAATLRMIECYVYENGTTVGENDNYYLHMSMDAISPNSDCYDIYNPLLDGSPNFCFTKLSKSYVKAENFLLNSANPVLPENWVLPYINGSMINQYGKRTADNVRDRYFTWDYDMRQIKNEDLKFNIQYKRVNTKRGLWIHQINDKIDNSDYLKYAMKGADQCINDGSNIHLGYMPSEWALINIMNREDDNSRPQNQFDEGVAIDGEDYRGMLLYDDNRDLVAIIDAGAARDITSGCYVAQLPKTVDIGGKRYGLLTEIEVE